MVSFRFWPVRAMSLCAVRTLTCAPARLQTITAAKKNHWKFVDIYDAFLTHGYTSTDTWIRKYDQSLEMEGSIDGFFHPNAAGEQAIAQQLLAAYSG